MRACQPRRVRKQLAAQPAIVQLEALSEVARMMRKITVHHPSGFLMRALQVGLCCAAGTLPGSPSHGGLGLPAPDCSVHLCSAPHGHQAWAWHCVALGKVCLTQHGRLTWQMLDSQRLCDLE